MPRHRALRRNHGFPVELHTFVATYHRTFADGRTRRFTQRIRATCYQRAKEEAHRRAERWNASPRTTSRTEFLHFAPNQVLRGLAWPFSLRRSR